jgi:ABC-type Fe3+ transport system substrate-binding protein
MTLKEFLEAVGGEESNIIEYATESESMEAVKQNGYALKYVKEQTEAVCLEAVKQNGDALQYVKKQTEAVCLEAVKQDGYALQYVKKLVFVRVEQVTQQEIA